MKSIVSSHLIKPVKYNLMSLSPKQLHEYQRKAILHQLYNDNSMLWIDCGLGKTIITLTTIEHRKRAGQVDKVLIFGPLRVILNVWENESKKWSHVNHLTFSIINGTPKHRIKALKTKADIYLCNYENMSWLTQCLNDMGQDRPVFQMVVYDEVTRLKNSTSQRIKGGKRVVDKGKPTEHKIKVPGWRQMIGQFQYTTGLTGTPAANGYLDLFGQYLVVDGGKRLGEYITHYRNNYFISDYNGWNYELTPLGKQIIEEKINDITIQTDAEDYLTLPPLIVNDILVNLCPATTKKYKEIEKNFFTLLDSGHEIDVTTRATAINKMLQFANGAPYLEPGQPEYVELHDKKLEALDSVIWEAQGKTVLVGYTFKSDAARIMKRYRRLNPVNLTESPPGALNDIIDKGKQGKIKIMIAHPASLGHGVDGLNEFCNTIVWFGLPWSLELYEQMNGRLIGGQRFRKSVTIHRILADKTFDLVVSDALENKDLTQQGLKNSLFKLSIIAHMAVH